MSKLVCHMGKYTKGNVFGLQKHNQRENENYSNENIDLEQSINNYDIKNPENIKYHDKVNEIIKKYRLSNRAVRKDAIVYVETIVSSDKAFFKDFSRDERERFFKESYNYLSDKIGKNNVVTAVVHLDETKGPGGAPHMHFGFVPITEDGKLSAKTMINRNFLREVQAEFPKYLQEKGFDIERGMEKSLNKHLEPLAFKKEQIKKDISSVRELEQKIQNVSEALSKADEHVKGVTGRLKGIEAKPRAFSDKLTISKEDYSILMQLAKQGEGKLLENIQLQSKINTLTEERDKYKQLNHNKIETLNELEKENRTLKNEVRIDNKAWERINKAIRNLGMIDEVEAEYERLKNLEKTLKLKLNRDFEL